MNDCVAAHLSSWLPALPVSLSFLLQKLKIPRVVFTHCVIEHVLFNSGIFLVWVTAKHFTQVMCFGWSEWQFGWRMYFRFVEQQGGSLEIHEQFWLFLQLSGAAGGWEGGELVAFTQLLLVEYFLCQMGFICKGWSERLKLHALRKNLPLASHGSSSCCYPLLPHKCFVDNHRDLPRSQACLPPCYGWYFRCTETTWEPMDVLPLGNFQHFCVSLLLISIFNWLPGIL